MNQPPPPTLPTGWIALWDPSSNRYYYVEEATGRTQWELPPLNPPPYTPTSGNINTPVDQSKGSPYQNQNASYYNQQYPTYQQTPVQPSPVQNTTIQVTESPTTQKAADTSSSRGAGSFAGGALTGGLLGFATAKIVSNVGRNSRMAHCPPPPPCPPRVNNVFVTGGRPLHGGGLMGGPMGGPSSLGPPGPGRRRRRF